MKVKTQIRIGMSSWLTPQGAAFAEQVRYWQSRPTWERFRAIAELSAAEYLRKHPEALHKPPTSGWDKAKVSILPFPEGFDDK